MSRGVTAEEVMTKGVWAVGPASAVTEAAGIMSDEEVRFLPVVEPSGRVVGVITMRDLVVRLVSARLPLATRVDEVMTEAVISCRTGDDLRVCERLMHAHQVRRLVVVDDEGRLAGVLSVFDLVQHAQERRLREIMAEVSGRTTVLH